MADAAIKTEDSDSPQFGRQRCNSDPKPSIDTLPSFVGAVSEGPKGDSSFITSGSATTPRPVKFSKGGEYKNISSLLECNRAEPKLCFPFLSGLVVAAPFSGVNARAWSPVYCMARRGNFHIIAAVDMATRSCLHKITFRDLLAYPVRRSFEQNMQNRLFLLPAKATHSSCRPAILLMMTLWPAKLP
ncbi:hypothetical protein PoB_006802100 [Plakobranchus ocellatus]|uniref:Uncharacterized protein n=1 Tax=Plakobranchus ocellatus TaxID=259542 RepID=A0AAV4DBK1_9GAST|nr:hypothetical protein PoB_006802100 [Plakobranchus ocellatus]